MASSDQGFPVTGSDASQTFAAYEARFIQEFGEVVEGGYASFRGKLVPRLTQSEHANEEANYRELLTAYLKSMHRGDTINDVVVRMVREHATRLILEDPVTL